MALNRYLITNTRETGPLVILVHRCGNVRDNDEFAVNFYSTGLVKLPFVLWLHKAVQRLQCLSQRVLFYIYLWMLGFLLYCLQFFQAISWFVWVLCDLVLEPLFIVVYRNMSSRISALKITLTMFQKFILICKFTTRSKYFDLPHAKNQSEMMLFEVQMSVIIIISFGSMKLNKQIFLKSSVASVYIKIYN